ncbi:MAG TPA: diiron oxygenase [Blastocatellia bacterium]|jgi:hypothetical protein|nr:diiron oxygenase [Blastocatellia bacterium]
MSEFATTVERLCEASKRDYMNPYSSLEWPETLDPEQWFTSPELISLYGSEAYDRLREPVRKRLSFYEAVNFFSLNIHGEKALVEGLARRLYARGPGGSESEEVTGYLHHFLDEENKHMIYFGRFCTKYAGKIYPDKKMAFPREYEEGEEDFLFFAKIMIFEEISDAFNVRMARDDRLVPLARRINLLHHRDEARHLVFGRRMVKELFTRHSEKWSGRTLEGVREYVGNYLKATWREYYNPEVYKDAGLDSPYETYSAALDEPGGRERRRRISEPCVRYLLENEILIEEPLL